MPSGHGSPTIAQRPKESKTRFLFNIAHLIMMLLEIGPFSFSHWEGPALRIGLGGLQPGPRAQRHKGSKEPFLFKKLWSFNHKLLEIRIFSFWDWDI